ncbi:MAG: hypothetical protein ACREDM_00290, partial [Methylocella sp.]
LAAWRASRVPSPGRSISKAKAVIFETPGMLAGIAKRPARPGFDNGQDGCFDSGDPAFDPFEAPCILALQRRDRQDAGAVPGLGAIPHQGFAGNMKLLEPGERIAAGASSSRSGA